MTLKALIFDVDGTLAETEELHRAAFNATFAEAGLPWHWDIPLYGALLKVTGGKERMRAYRDQLGETRPDEADIARLHARKTAIYTRLVAEGRLLPRPGVMHLIEDARRAGLHLAVATTTSPANVEALVQAIWQRSAREVFDVIAAGDEVAAKKPAPDVYCLALARLGISAQEAIAFEDSVAGLTSARAAGLRVIVTPSTYTAHEAFEGQMRLAPDLSDIGPCLGVPMRAAIAT